MWCASFDRLGLLHLQLLFSKNAAFLSHVTTEQNVLVRSCGGGRQHLVSLMTNLQPARPGTSVCLRKSSLLASYTT